MEVLSLGLGALVMLLWPVDEAVLAISLLVFLSFFLLVVGVLEVSIILGPLSLLLVPVSLVLVGIILIRENPTLGFV